MPVKHAFVSPVLDDADPNSVSPSHWNDDHPLVDYLDYPLPSGAVGAPPANTVRAFMKSVAGRAHLAMMGPSGLDSILQEHLGRNKVSMWNPAGNSTTITVIGAAIDLTGAIVLIRWQSGATLVERPMVVTNAPAGVAEYAFGAGELEYSGPVSIVEGVRVSAMKFEVEITDGNGKKMTNLRTIDVWLRDQLG